MFGLGTGELLVILMIVVLLFGAKRIPEIMQGMGKGIRTFKKAMDNDEQPAAASASAQAESGSKPKEDKAEPK
jgi:sec-independent protein translocase protein TatA